jgi:transposase
MTSSDGKIPAQLSEKDFNEFVFPFLTIGSRGPKPKISFHKIFNYILYLMHTGCQWYMLPIDKTELGQTEISYTRIFRHFKFWSNNGSFDKIFESSVARLFKFNLVDISVLHGDGTTTAAKKGGDNIGRSGHKHMTGDKVVSICDRNCNVIAPFVTAPGNRNESPMFPDVFKSLKKIAKVVGFSLRGSVMSLDGVYDCKKNRKMIFNAHMTPNINENKRNRKATKRGKKRIFCASIFKERFKTIERVFAWEDKFKRLLVRFEHLSAHHYSMKTIAFTMINLRHFCKA